MFPVATDTLFKLTETRPDRRSSRQQPHNNCRLLKQRLWLLHYINTLTLTQSLASTRVEAPCSSSTVFPQNSDVEETKINSNTEIDRTIAQADKKTNR